jgi:hypothetical protein
LPALVIVGLALSWGWLIWRGDLCWNAWARAAFVGASLIACSAGLAGLLHRLPWAPPCAKSAAALLTFAWLAAPLWLFPLPVLREATVQQAAALHPLFAIQSAAALENWTEMGFAYQLMTLNQDIPFTPPQSTIPCASLHLGLAAAAATAAWLLRRRPPLPAPS